MRYVSVWFSGSKFLRPTLLSMPSLSRLSWRKNYGCRMLDAKLKLENEIQKSNGFKSKTAAKLDYAATLNISIATVLFSNAAKACWEISCGVFKNKTLLTGQIWCNSRVTQYTYNQFVHREWRYRPGWLLARGVKWFCQLQFEVSWRRPWYNQSLKCIRWISCFLQWSFPWPLQHPGAMLWLRLTALSLMVPGGGKK